MTQTPILEIKGFVKDFPGVRALDHVDFDLNQGEVHILVGENGAGKSTMIKILSGAYSLDEGQIFWEGHPVAFHSPRDAAALGIFTIYQEIIVVPALSVMENIWLGELEGKNGKVNWKQIRIETQRILKLMGVDNVRPNQRLSTLSVAQQQLITIARALRRKSRVIIMDEPTSTLTPSEIEFLFNTIRKLANEGVSIIYISHRLEEIKQIGDRITVLRDGKKVGTIPVKDYNRQEIIQMMVGRDVLVEPRQCRTRDDRALLKVENLRVGEKIKDVSFVVRPGEVVGVAGLIGSGRTEIARAIFGADKKTSGKIYIDEKEVQINSPADAITAGLALVPEDRKIQGLVDVLSVQVNMMLAYGEQYHKNGLLNKNVEKKLAKEYIHKLTIKTPSLQRMVMDLSGGNQQKVVLSRWLCMNMKVLILDEVTRGIDVGAKAEIYQFIDQLACDGYGIVMISSELPEILTLSDRILVVHNGRITGELERKNATQEKIMDLAIAE